MRVEASLLLLALLASPGPYAAATGDAAEAVREAVRGLEACCGGELERASRDTRARWARALYGWVVVAGGRPDAARLAAAREALERQALRLDPAAVARLAVQEGLPEGPPSPVAARPAPDLQRFAESLFVLGLLEREELLARQARDRAIEQAHSSFREALRDLGEDRGWAGKELARAAKQAGAFDFERAFAERHKRLTERLEAVEKQVKAVQDEAFEYQAQWTENHRELKPGTAAFLAAMGEYQHVIDGYDRRVKALMREVEELERRRARYRSGPQPWDLDAPERPGKE